MKIPKSVRKTEYGYCEIIDKPSQADLSKYYADKYYQDSISKSYAKEYSADETKHINNKDRESVEIIKKYFDSNLAGKKFLDIGCGEGFALKHFKSEDCEVRGVDYADFGIQSHNPDMLQYFYKGDLLEFIKQSIENKVKFDIINLDNVLEHVIDPVGLLNDLRELLADRGILRIQVPNDFSSLQEELLRLGKITEYYWVSPPDHLSYFNTESLRNLLIALNYKIITVTGDYPIELFLFSENTNYIKNREVGKSCHESRVLTENFLYQTNFEKTLKLYELLAEMGLGRVITFYVTKSAFREF